MPLYIKRSIVMSQLKIIQTKVFQKWFNSLSPNINDKITEYIYRALEGNTSNCKTLRKGISEITIDFQKGYKIYYTILQNNTVLLLLAAAIKKDKITI
ncbi:MAG: hypothetical protein LBT07_01990 [Endomicrobium sp.]|nr:hypothetical protein [Endomicrobium sp.]